MNQFHNALVATVFVLSSTPSFVNAADAADAAEESSFLDVVPWAWLEGKRDQMSRNVTALGRSLDQWLAGEGIGDQVNETYLRVRLNQVKGTYDGYNSKLKLGGRLDLPTVSERWKLIFDSDVDDLNSLQENRLDEIRSSSSIGGFRYQHKTDSGWDFSHDVGLHAEVPVDPFYRFRGVYGRELSEDWSLGFRQKVYHYDSDGWGSDTELSFVRELEADRFLRVASEVSFKDNYNTTEFGQTVGLHRTLGDMETISYEVGLIGINRPNVRINDYYTQVLYRKSVYEDWVIIEAVPQILVSRDDNWRPQPRLIFNLELLFFDF